MNPRTFTASALALFLLAGTGVIVHEPQQPPRHQDDGWLDVMTYNVHKYWSTGKTGQNSILAIGDVIADANPDIVGLQETDGGRVTSGGLDGIRWLSHTLGYHAIKGPTGRDGSLGVSLLSKWPVLADEWVPLPGVEGSERGVLIATLGHPVGALSVAVTHLSSADRPADRARQAEGLVRVLDDRDPLILMGDFNTPPSFDAPPYRTLAGSFEDAWVIAGLPRTSGATQLDADDPARVDQIWIRGDWIVDSCRVHGDGRASDHRAAVCRLQRANL